MLNRMRTPLIALSILLPTVAFADTTPHQNFKSDCVGAWMKSAPTDAEDKLEYQNFGEKYCGCAATKPLSNQDEINKAAQTCMAQTLLRDVMDDMEDDPGLDKLTSDNLLSACKDKWTVVYPKASTDPSAPTNRYCQCATPKLIEINNSADDLTDDQWYAKIDEISVNCAATIIPEKETAPAAKKPM